MLLCRIKRVVTSLCLSCVVVFGPVHAYEIPDGIDPADVFIGYLAVDTFEGTYDPTLIYAIEIDQDGIYMVPDGYIFLPGASGNYVSTRAFAAILGGATDAALEETTLAAVAEFKVGPGPFDTSSMRDASLAKITFTPEIRFTANGSPVAQSRAVFSLAPRLTCQELRTNIAVEDCGGGLEIGFTGRSEDGLSTFTARAGADRISGRTATTLQLGVNVRF